MSKEGESFGADCSPLGMGNQTKGLNTGWCHFGEDMGGVIHSVSRSDKWWQLCQMEIQRR